MGCSPSSQPQETLVEQVKPELIAIESSTKIAVDYAKGISENSSSNRSKIGESAPFTLEESEKTSQSREDTSPLDIARVETASFRPEPSSNFADFKYESVDYEDDPLPVESGKNQPLFSQSATIPPPVPPIQARTLSSGAFMLKPWPSRSGQSLLQLERTSKFAAFNIRPRNCSQPATELRTLRKLSERKLSRAESMLMIGNLRDTLHKLNTIQFASPVKKPQLLRLDSTGSFQTCSRCSCKRIKGLMCEEEHFSCVECLAPYVEDICKNTDILKGKSFVVSCPVAGCTSKPWNTYHVRKILDGSSLELYIDTLVKVCREEELENTTARASLSTAAVFTGGEKYPNETMEILRAQIRKLGLVPMEYIPLEEIREELQSIFDMLNNDEPYDEKRMDFLLMCMEQNPVYIQEKEAEVKQWRDEMSIFTKEALDTMRGFIPPHIFEATLGSLQEDDGLPKDLAKRIMTKKCLWLIRMNILDIEKIHEVELMGRFNPVAQQLDIIELAAIYACIPEKFLNDPSGRKAEWKLNVENSLKDMDKLRRSNQLLGSKARHLVYKKMQSRPAPFLNRNTVRTMDIIEGLKDDGF